jgi:hypothetical protein
VVVAWGRPGQPAARPRRPLGRELR